MWDWLDSWCCSLPTTRQKPPNQSPLLTAASRPNRISFSFSAAAEMLISWLNRRRRRYLLLILCSPFLVPLLCATCPIICAVELCFLISRRRRRRKAGRGGSGDGGGDELGLLQRYLEDQLMLVCGNDDLGEGGGVDVECFDRAGAVLQ